MDVKLCFRCQVVKPVSDFGKNLAQRDGLAGYCKSCTKEYRRERADLDPEGTRKKQAASRLRRKNGINSRNRDRYASDPGPKREKNEEWRKANPEKHAESVRRSQLKRLYGLTPDQYDRMVDDLDGKCPVCLKAPLYAGKPRRLAVDHDHNTSKVRGLLCWRCNGAMGIIGEENLHRLLKYLADAESQQ